MQTTLRGIANKASSDKGHRFRNLFGLLTVGFLMGCWRFINPKATSILTPGELDGRVMMPEEGSPQGGIISPVLANVYLHRVLDQWFEETVKAHCRGTAYFCRYADDFVAAFQYETDARRFYEVLGKRLGRYGLTLAADKTRLLRFDRNDRRHSAAFEVLGFEFRWGLSRWRKPLVKRRTATKKYRVALANPNAWFRENSHRPQREFFAQLAAKLRGYYQYYGIRGNYERIRDFFYHAKRMLYQRLNRRIQRKSYNWKGFAALVEHFQLPRPRICHDF